MLKNSIKAPDFKLSATPDKQISLSEFIGKKIILVFYPADWSPVCGDELAIFSSSLKLFEKYNVQILGISVDSKWSHAAFSENRKLKFPLLADFEPKGAISIKYEAYSTATGTSKRAIYLIDEMGIIRWSYLSPDNINPGVDGVLDALENLIGEK
ncbi:redoxin domain-containing protein [Orbus wheelerorum]|uniref:redoxin domain-containing protein n=1 Tax=Orbus wheelerorum TaxID=3074111 RepID=UPI00370D7CB4